MKEIVRVEGLKKTFVTPAGDLPILKGIDATFYGGEMVGIVGASGAGKSTFLHIMGGLDRPTDGQVLYRLEEGEQEAAGEVKWINPFMLSGAQSAIFRNRSVGFIFQFHYLLPEFTALENTAMPGFIAAQESTDRRKGQEDAIERASFLLAELGLAERKKHKPGELSGGEQQRVAVARALLQNPRLVLADEPTGNLDHATGEELFELLLRINQERGITFVIVTHNPSLSGRCSRVLEMTDGVLSPRRDA